MARTETLRPSRDVSTTWDDPLEDHAAVVSDGSDDTGISVLSTVGAVDRFTLSPLPTDATDVTGVSVRFRVDSEDGAGRVRARLFDGVNLLAGPTWVAGTATAWFTWSPATAPDGGPWSPDSFDGLVIDAECVALGLGRMTVREIAVPVAIEESTESHGAPAVVELAPRLSVPVELAPRSAVPVELGRSSVVVVLADRTAVPIEVASASAVLDTQEG